MDTFALGNPVTTHPLNRGLEFWASGRLRPFAGSNPWTTLTWPRQEGVRSGGVNSPNPSWIHAPASELNGFVREGLAIQSDGTNHYSFGLPYIYGKGLDNLRDAGAIMCWVYKPNANQDSGAFIKIGNQGLSSTQSGVAIGIGGTTFDNNGLQVLFLVEGIAWHPTGDNLGTGWSHIAATWQRGATTTLYVVHLNGRPIYATNAANILSLVPSADGIFALGYTGNGGENRHCGLVAMDDIRIFSRFITNEEIVAQFLEKPFNYQNTLRRLPRSFAFATTDGFSGPLIGPRRLMYGGSLLNGRLVL